MTKKYDFPNADDFISEGDDISGNVSELSEFISRILKASPNLYKDKTLDFIKTKLPAIWSNILTSFHKSRVKTNDIKVFIENYCQLCVDTDLIPSLLNVIPSAFDESFTRGKFYKIDTSIPEEEIDKILDNSYFENSNGNESPSILLPSSDRPAANPMMNPLIIQIIQSRMFLTARNLFENNSLTIEQISAIDQIFTCIESSISQELVSALLPILINITISLIETEYLNSKSKASNDDIDKNILPRICKFLSTFSQMIPTLDTIDSILKVLCDLSIKKKQVTVRLIAISEMIQIIDSVGYGNSIQMVKDAMINALATSNQQSLINSVCKFLPKLSKAVQFNDDDLHNLLLKARNGDEKTISAFVDVINSVERDIDSCASELTNYDILSPALYCTVIGKTSDENITRVLFHQLLSQTDRLMDKKGSIPHVILNDRIKQHMNEGGVDLIKLLTFLFLCAPNVDTVCEIIIDVFNLPELPDDLIPMLQKFARKLNDFNSTPSILALFNVLIKRLKTEEELDKSSKNEEDNKNQHFTDSLVQVVTQWIKTSTQINTESSKILKQLSELDFSQINDYVPCLVNELISKSDSNSNIDFLFKVLKDTVPERHTQWLIYSLFTLVHDNENYVKNIFDIIIGHLQMIKDEENKNVNKYVNAIYLLYNAVTYEADFFKIGEQNYGFLQNVILHLQDGNDTDLRISLHPFHSTRRIFAEVANAMNIEIDLLKLNLSDHQDHDSDDGEKEEEQEFPLIYNAPLQTISRIGFIKEKNKNEANINYTEIPIEIYLQKNNNEYPSNPPTYPTPFLDLLSTKVTILFDLIEVNYELKENNLELESEYLFQIIKLFPQLNLDPKNPIQEVIVDKVSFENAMLFKDSPRIFPYVVACLTNNLCKETTAQSSQQSQQFNENDEVVDLIKQFIIQLASHNYDIVSLSIACASLLKIDIQFCFDEEDIKKCFLDCKSSQIRTIASKFVSTKLTNGDSFISLLDYALMKQNRTKTKSFFECVSRMNFDKEIFIPFYQKLEQFEFSYYSDIDQTFISLLSLIPQTQEMVDLTIKRLFSPPTCRSETVPFVHTIESWAAALKFIETNLSIQRLHSLVSMVSLPQDLIHTKLSSDFTFKGRIGIINMGSTCYMNSLLQLLNTFQRVSYNIISKDTKVSDHMTPFILELRNCLAKLRYLRGTTLSLGQFSKTIEPDKKFDPTSQQDIEEFFNIVINKVSEDLKEEDDITNLMKIQVSNNVSVDNEIVATSQETIFNLSLPIENLSNLSDAFDAYFEDESIEYTVDDKRKPASLWKSIKKWPDYLVIQLQRWSFKIETMLHKLVHEFDFPVNLKREDIKVHHETQKCDSDYTLSGVVIHQGTAEQGHYNAIVLGDDNEWYFCNDKEIQYFDISDLATFSYGKLSSPEDSQNPDEISTGYILFYKKIGLEKEDQSNVCVLPSDLEEEIDSENAKNWPSIIFYSGKFVDYARRMARANSSDPKMLDIAFTVLFKISICDENTLWQWVQFMIDDILNVKSKSENEEVNFVFDLFFDYIEKEIGTSLVHLFAISEKISNYLYNLIHFALTKVPNSTKPIRSIMKCVPEGQFLKRMFCLFIFDTISDVYQILRNTINWSEEDETLIMMMNILSMQLSKEVQRQISEKHKNAMNNVLNLFIDVVHVKGCNETVLSVFDIARMNRINYIYKKCDNFNRLMLTVNQMQPEFFYETPDANPATLELLSPILSQQNVNENDSSEQLILDLSFLFPSLELLIFCNDRNVRYRACDSLIEMAGKKDVEMVNYLNESLIKNQFSLSLKEENTVALFVIGQFDQMKEIIYESLNDNKQNSNNNDDDDDEVTGFVNEAEEIDFYDSKYPNESICIEFADVVLRICSITPNVFQNNFRTITEMFLNSKHMILKRKLLEIVHHILAYDKSIINDDSYTDLFDQILETNVTSSYAIQILWALQEKANNSLLFGACIEHYLSSDYDENAEILINMLKNGLKPPEVEIPEEAKDFIRLRIVNELWSIWTDKRRELANFMLSAFNFAKPYALFENSDTLKKTIELLKDFCEDELKVKIEEVSKPIN